MASGRRRSPARRPGRSPGCWSWPAICASSTNRRSKAGCLARGISRSTLTARSRPRLTLSRPLRTAPIPPRAISPKICSRHGRAAGGGTSGELGRRTATNPPDGSASRSRTRGRPATTFESRSRVLPLTRHAPSRRGPPTAKGHRAASVRTRPDRPPIRPSASMRGKSRRANRPAAARHTWHNRDRSP